MKKAQGQRKKSFEEIRVILQRIDFCPTGDEKNRRTLRFDYVDPQQRDPDHYFLQVVYLEPDILTGKRQKQFARKWLISPFMTETEIVETAFAACRRSMDHVTKEAFLYKGQRVFSPHFDIEARVGMAKRGEFEVRVPIPAPAEAPRRVQRKAKLVK